MSYALHTFRPTETIDGVLRLLGRHNLTKAELEELRRQFNELNGTIVPRVGATCKIPLPADSTAQPAPETAPAPVEEPVKRVRRRAAGTLQL